MKPLIRQIGDLSYPEKIQFYSQHTRTIPNLRAMFADGSGNYLIPSEPKEGDEVRFRFRAAKGNVDGVTLHIGGTSLEMEVAGSVDMFDYFETGYTVSDSPLSYYFEVRSGSYIIYYNKKGPSDELDHSFDFGIIPGFSTPEWAKGAVMYQIFVDRFANGDLKNDVVDREYSYIRKPVWHMNDWYKCPDAMDVRNFYGGDLQGILDHLDYLKDLGIDVIYMNPIFVSPSNHKYDVQDYDYVDPHFTSILKDRGDPLPEWETDNRWATKYASRVTDPENLEESNRFFAHFTEEVHKKGMRVILDGVFNHCGSFNKWMDAERIYEGKQGFEQGAYVSENSPYREFFLWKDENEWPYNDEYEGWWGHKTLPKLNYEGSEKLCEYMADIGRKWVSPPYNVDGWRLDVAADLGPNEVFNHLFWKMFRSAVKEINPDVLILAEHYEDPSSWLMGDEWDTIMNYSAFMEPITWFLTGMEKHSDYRRPDYYANPELFREAMTFHMARLPYPSIETSMNELSNHDHSRFLTRTNMTPGRLDSHGAHAAGENIRPEIMRAAVMMQMTWPGAPTVYYGDEAGLTGWTDPDNRRTYPWGREDQAMLRYHKEMIRIHKEQKALISGSFKFLKTQDGVLAYGRFCNTGKLVTAVNAEPETKIVKIPVWEIEVTDQEDMVLLMSSDEEGFSQEPVKYPVRSGCIEITLPPRGALLVASISHTL